jgi:hypothetical protein
MARAMTGEDGRGLVAQRKAELKAELKAQRKAQRAELKVHARRARRLAEALEPLSIRERIRNQWEILGLERRFAEDLDRSVRYALIVFGVVNTGAVLVLTRANVFGSGSGPAAWGVRLFVALYALLVLNTLRDAVQSLRPRLASTPIPSIGMRLVFPHDAPEMPLSLSLMPMGANRPSEEDYHKAWQGITGEELSRQLSVASLALGGLGETKLAALRRLYAGVALSLIVTAVLIAAVLLTSAL